MKGKCKLYIDEPMLEGHWFFYLPLDKQHNVAGFEGIGSIEDYVPVFGTYVTITYKGEKVYEGFTGYEPIPDGVDESEWIKWFREGADIAICSERTKRERNA